MAHTSTLTAAGVMSLLSRRCPRLRSIGDLDCFTGVTDEQRAELRKWIRANNLALEADGSFYPPTEYGLYLESEVI